MDPRLVHYSDIEGVYDAPERAGRLVSTVRELNGPDAVIAGTGDNTAPGVLPLVERGRQAIPFFRALDGDFETFGNHDFDYGSDTTLEVVRGTPQTWVSANVYLDGDRFGAADGVVPTAVRVIGGVRIGVFGVTDPETASINPDATHFEFADPYEAAADAVADLRDRDVDRIVALSHLGSGDERLATEVDIDVVLGGHVHTERVERVGGTVLTRPGQGGHVVLEVSLGPEPTVTRHAVADAPVDTSIRDTLIERHRAADLDAVVATVADPIDRSDETVFSGESRIGNFIADAYRATLDADVGLQNSGGIRAGEPLAGAVTTADLISVLPFDEPVALGRVTGAELRAIVTEGTGAYVGFDEPDWWHAQLSGVRVTVDRRDHTVESLEVAGEPVDPEATYTVATSDYLFETQTEFPTLTPAHRIATGPKQYEALIEYARSAGIAPAVEGRIAFL